MQAVIMAGGKGSRLISITKDEIPKPMVNLNGKPLLVWQIEQLKRYGINRITMVTGYLGEKIREYFQDGKAFGCTIDYIVEEEPLGTAGSFFYLKEKIKDEYFMLVFGDIFFDIDIRRMEAFHREKSALATLFVHPNSHPFDSDLIESDKEGRVLRFDSKHNKRDYWYDNIVNAGLYIIDKKLCERVERGRKTDLEKELLAPMAEQKEAIYAYSSPEFVKDVGTVERIEKTMEEIKSGFIASKNLEYLQSAIFLDRDGTINQLRGFIHREEDFELEEGVIEAIKRINSSGMLAIVVTNQPVIARGLCEPEDVEKIHKKMKTLLGREGAFLDGLFYCPHHPDKGFPEENPAYKIECECRKPKTGMIEEAARRYHIDLSGSWIIGDTTLDIELGKRAGLRSVLLESGEGGRDGKYDAKPDFSAKNLDEAVKRILEKRGRA
ncbi:MAG: HAD-IIIA family hydrolase [Johnsonella sp.]|nr:HAD-IIIA family hydrolase [Johnsonella sp.]